MGFLRGFSIAMGANIVVFVLSFLNNKIIYLFLSKEDNGVFFLLLRITLLLSIFFGDWHRLSSMNVAGSDRKFIPVLSSNGLWYSVSLCILLMFPVVLFPSVFKGKVFGVPSQYLLAVVIVFCTYIARNNWQSLLLVSRRMFSYGFTLVLWAGIFLLLDVLFLIIFKYGLTSVVAAFVIATMASSLWAFGSSLSANGHTFRPSWNVFGMTGKIGLRAWVAILGMFVMINCHIFTIQALAATPEEGLAMVAIFSVCYRVFALFQRGPDVAGSVLYSHIVQQDHKSSSNMVMLTSRNIILVSFVFAIIVALAGKSLIILIAKKEYLAAYYPLLVMLPGILAINAGSVINSFYWGRNYPLKIIVAPYIITLFALGLNVVLIPRFGVSGATLSFSLMSVLWMIYQIVSFSKDSGLEIRDIIIPRVSDIEYVFSKIRHAFNESIRSKTRGTEEKSVKRI